MKIQTMKELVTQLQAVARGDIPAPADVALPSAGSAKAELEALAAPPDDQINTREVPDAGFLAAERSAVHANA